jgi:hypothetical protein
MLTDNRDIAILFRGTREERRKLRLADSRLARVSQALNSVGIKTHPAVFNEAFADEVRDQLLELDGVLVWVDPLAKNADRTALDEVLLEVAQQGLVVSAHPDTIAKIGTKEVLYTTRDMSWGCDTRLYTSLDDFRGQLPEVLAEGQARVLKQFRGNGGFGVYKVARLPSDDKAITGETLLTVREARRGGEETLSFNALVERCTPYFAGTGRMIDQPFQERLAEGMVRCYVVCDRVCGFGEQLINMLYPNDAEGAPVEPGPRLYFPPNRSDFQPLKRQMEQEWIPALQKRFRLDQNSLPVIWDADFLRGPKTADGADTWVLCEINVCSVLPFPDEALVPMAKEVRERL